MLETRVRDPLRTRTRCGCKDPEDGVTHADFVERGLVSSGTENHFFTVGAFNSFFDLWADVSHVTFLSSFLITHLQTRILGPVGLI